MHLAEECPSFPVVWCFFTIMQPYLRLEKRTKKLRGSHTLNDIIKPMLILSLFFFYRGWVWHCQITAKVPPWRSQQSWYCTSRLQICWYWYFFLSSDSRLGWVSPDTRWSGRIWRCRVLDNRPTGLWACGHWFCHSRLRRASGGAKWSGRMWRWGLFSSRARGHWTSRCWFCHNVTTWKGWWQSTAGHLATRIGENRSAGFWCGKCRAGQLSTNPSCASS